jgi:hypothetical protein
MPENNDKALLVRLDERSAYMTNQMVDLKNKIEILEAKFEKNFVSKEEFVPVQRVIYAAVGLIISIFFAVISTQVFHTGPIK